MILHTDAAETTYDVESDTFGDDDWDPVIPECGYSDPERAFAAAERWQQQAAEDGTGSRFRVVQVKRTPVTRLSS